jgi:hypothetical protein
MGGGDGRGHRRRDARRRHDHELTGPGRFRTPGRAGLVCGRGTRHHGRMINVDLPGLLLALLGMPVLGVLFSLR